MATVTERLVLRFSAPTKSYTVPDFVLSTICGFYRDSTSYPEWSLFISRWIFNNNYRLFKFGLNLLSGSTIYDYQLPEGQLYASSIAISLASG